MSDPENGQPGFSFDDAPPGWSTESPTAPGWYHDPEGRHSHQAYWDGERWTGETRSRARGKASPGVVEMMKLLAAIILLIGMGAAVWGFINLRNTVWHLGLEPAIGEVVEEPSDVFNPFNWDTSVWIRHKGGVAEIRSPDPFFYRIGDKVEFYVHDGGNTGSFTTWAWHGWQAFVGLGGAALLLLAQRKLSKFVYSGTAPSSTKRTRR